MIVQRMAFPTCSTGPRAHLSAGKHDGQYWVQISDGQQILIAHLEPEEWTKWLAELPAVAACEQRAAVIGGAE